MSFEYHIYFMVDGRRYLKSFEYAHSRDEWALKFLMENQGFEEYEIILMFSGMLQKIATGIVHEVAESEGEDEHFCDE